MLHTDCSSRQNWRSSILHRVLLPFALLLAQANYESPHSASKPLLVYLARLSTSYNAVLNANTDRRSCTAKITTTAAEQATWARHRVMLAEPAQARSIRAIRYALDDLEDFWEAEDLDEAVLEWQKMDVFVIRKGSSIMLPPLCVCTLQLSLSRLLPSRAVQSL